MLVVVRAQSKRVMLGRYELVKHLAQGGMADVLLARAQGIEGFQRHVVIKRIRVEQARDSRYVKMFLDEARLAAALHHQNIVQVHDIGEEGGEYFFAMEYVHGEDVRKLLTKLSEKEQRVPLEHVVTIAAAAAAGLHHAHEQRGPDRAPLGIVHRDVSPANILIGYDGSVKVADFGIAKAASSTETHSGTLKGKVAYMSPEQCVAEPVDRRSDVFALGIVLYELVTVRRLFKGDNDFLTMSSIVLGHIPPPSTVCADLPKPLEEIIMKALSPKPADRYQTADEMRVALEKYATQSGLRTSTTGLADYLKQQFGLRPEPWLDDDDEPEIELGGDFDGTASGVADVPSEGIIDLAAPTGAPIQRARSKAITDAPPMLRRVPSIELAVPHAPSRRRLYIAAGSVAVVAIAISLKLVGGHGKGTSDAAPAASASPTTEPVKSPPLPSWSDQATVPIVSPPTTTAATPAPAPTPVAAPPEDAGHDKTVKSHKKPAKPGPKKHWDPNALFPD